jgi:hypothetical protein
MRPALVVGAAMLFSSGCADHTDFSGTYFGDGSGSYVSMGGAPVEFRIPHDAITVKMTRRHYQYSEVEVTVRGCVVRSSNGGETTWSLASGDGGKCVFDVPSVGPVEISLRGGAERRPPTRTSKPDEVHVSLQGTNERGQRLAYTIDAKPKK